MSHTYEYIAVEDILNSKDSSYEIDGHTWLEDYEYFILAKIRKKYELLDMKELEGVGKVAYVITRKVVGFAHESARELQKIKKLMAESEEQGAESLISQLQGIVSETDYFEFDSEEEYVSIDNNRYSLAIEYDYDNGCMIGDVVLVASLSGMLTQNVELLDDVLADGKASVLVKLLSNTRNLRDKLRILKFSAKSADLKHAIENSTAFKKSLQRDLDESKIKITEQEMENVVKFAKSTGDEGIKKWVRAKKAKANRLKKAKANRKAS